MSRALILEDLSIWDGDKLLDADSVRLGNGLIEAVGTSAALSAEHSRAERRSLSGAFLMPGLMDAHVHLVLDPERRTPPGRDEVPDLGAMRERAGAMVRAGITTARDLGGGHHRELALRDEINRGETQGPRLLCAGQPVTSVGGHCHFWGGEAAGAPAMCVVADRQLTAGADLLKVMATGGRMTGGSKPLLPQFSAEELAVFKAHAAAAGVPVAAHCHGTAGISAAVHAGIDTIEHCSWVGEGGWGSDYQPELAAAMARRGLRVSPTINAGWQRMVGTETGRRMGHALNDMIRLGVSVIASTDAGIPGVRHADLPRALAVFRALTETSNAFTLRTATAGAADGMGLSTVAGRISPGLSADLLLLDGNPLEDLSVLQAPLAVWARGQLVTA